MDGHEKFILGFLVFLETMIRTLQNYGTQLFLFVRRSIRG